MALKRVFQMDEDFQERMFAKQIAVMKGQAWNVVEALKTADHGPLELTRRSKVCVWDDLVDVPVAVPMRVTSSELRRNSNGNARQSMDEADIASSAPTGGQAMAVEDLLGLHSAPVEMPRAGRFDEVSNEVGVTSNQDGTRNDPVSSPGGTKTPDANPFDDHRATSRSLNAYDPARGRPYQQRRYSFASPSGRRNSSSIAQHLYGDSHEYDDDDLDGDLGYAAAEGQMGNRRKVIVERLEAVKSKNPVFTWC